jgi:hypothetical protein
MVAKTEPTALELSQPFSAVPTCPAHHTKKGPSFSDGPLLVININRGTNELNFADRGSEVNISGDRLAFVQTNA